MERMIRGKDQELATIHWLTECIEEAGYLDLSTSDPTGEEEDALNLIYFLLKDRENLLLGISE